MKDSESLIICIAFTATSSLPTIKKNSEASELLVINITMQVKMLLPKSTRFGKKEKKGVFLIVALIFWEIQITILKNLFPIEPSSSRT